MISNAFRLSSILSKKAVARQTCVQAGVQFSRWFSTTPESEVVTSFLDEKTGVATVTLNNKPVNQLSMDVGQKLTNQLTQLSQNKHCKAVILTSALPGVFCAGLDLQELQNPTVQRFSSYYSTIFDALLCLYTLPQYVVAAINGSALAGGCALALTCDYRIMTSNAKTSIGLVEPMLGVPLSRLVMQIFINQCGMQVGEQGLALGTAYTPTDALRVGLVHELTDSLTEDEWRSRVNQIVEKALQVPYDARAEIKRRLRQPLVEEMKTSRNEDVDNIVKVVTSNEIQAVIGSYLARLKKP